MKRFGSFENKNQDLILLYSLLSIVILTTTVFTVIYFIWLPFWPARIAHLVYLFINLSLIYFIREEDYLLVKNTIVFSNLIQLFLATFFWFPLSTNYALFYFLIPMGSFSIYNLLNKKERSLAFIASIISLILFMLASYKGINFALFEPSIIATKIVSFMTTSSTIGILALYFYLHAYFLAQKRSELEYLANTDSLTSIFNRRNFYELSETEFDLAKKYNHTFSLLLLDIDFFKKINDTYGHDIGDEVIIGIAKTIKKSVRQNDLFARYGGEEFTLLLRNTDADKAILIAEKIRKSIENLQVETRVGKINATISIGVVEFDQSLKKLTHLIIEVDKALYEAKEGGRNCVVYKDIKREES